MYSKSTISKLLIIYIYFIRSVFYIADCREEQYGIAPEEIKELTVTAGNLLANCTKVFDVHNIQFLLYNKINADFDVSDIDTFSLKGTTYNTSLETKVLFHPQFKDWTSMTSILNSYNQAMNVNVILVDYHKYAACALAGDVFPKIVPVITKFYQKLYDAGTTPDKLHIVADGLGAHLAGPAAKALNDQKPYRATGLDPGNDFMIQSGYMSPDDARFVDILHTGAGQSGTDKLVGTVDFFANGGTYQPYCNELDDECDHVIPIVYFAESILTEVGFWSAPCSLVQSNVPLNKSVEILWGEYVPMDVKGIYCFNTNANPPFAKGVINRA